MFQDLLIRLRGDSSQLTGAVKKSKKEINGFQKQLSGVSSTLKTVFVGAVSVAAVQSLRLAKDFTKSMTQIKALVGVASDEVDAMAVSARNMAIQTGKSSNEAAEALFFITSAGLRGADAMKVLEASLKASAVGLGQTKSVADLATSALNAYGTENLSAIEATDILTASVREGKLEASELAASMGRVLPVASNMGVEFHEVGAAFAAMSRTGTNAAEASTSLNAILSGLLKPTQDAEMALGEMGLSSKGLKQQIKDEGLLSVLKTLKTEFDKNSDASARVFPNLRALRGVLDLVGAGAETNAQIFDSLSKSLGATDEAFEKTKDASFEFDVQVAMLQDNLLSIGQQLLPLVNTGLQLLNKLLGNNEAENYAEQLQEAQTELEILQKREENARKALEKHIETRGTASKDLKTYQNNLVNAQLKLYEQEEIVNSLTDNIEKLNETNKDTVDVNKEVSDSVEQTNTIYQTYLDTIRKLVNQEQILGDEFDLTEESIKETQKSLIELLNANQQNTQAFKDLQKELKNLQSIQAVDLAEKLGLEADKELDSFELDFSDLEKELENVKTFKQMLNDILDQSNQDLSNKTNELFESQRVARQEQFKKFSEQAVAIANVVQTNLIAISDKIVESFGLADEGVQGFIKSMIKMLMQLAIQQAINSIITKAISKAQIAANFGTAQAGAITSATQTAATIPGGFFALPLMISSAMAMVASAFGGVTAFAKGGIVNSPMMGLVGEAGSEAIIPLDRLPGIINRTQGTQTGEFTLRGQDLILALERAGDFRARITG